MKIGFDFDDVLNDLSERWIAEMNRRYGLSVKYEELKSYHLDEAFPNLSPQELFEPYLDGTLYLDINPVKPAQELIADLSHTDEIYVITSNMLGVPYLPDYIWAHKFPAAPSYLLQFLWQYYEEIPTDHIIITRHKQMVRMHVMIDDNPANLQSASFTKVLLDKPYNHDYNAELHNMNRAFNYDDIRRYIEEARP